MNDIYTNVTNSIITALERGTPPWTLPWSVGHAVPVNLATNKVYRGINVILLHVAAINNNYDQNRWLTFRQANELGMRVRKNEHGTPIVFYQLRKIDGKDDEPAIESDTTKRRIPVLKSFTVFNISQLENVPERFQLNEAPKWQPVDVAEQVINQTGAVIRYGGQQAYYQPDNDIIQLPPPSAFSHAEKFYGTVLHELCHWSGNPSRLNRVLADRRDIEAYAYEELVAEIGAAFLCAHCGLPTRLEHASYVDSWLDALRRDKRLIFVAAGAAQKAADFILGTDVGEIN